MSDCYFTLNGEMHSRFVYDGVACTAFSGQGRHRNQPGSGAEVAAVLVLALGLVWASYRTALGRALWHALPARLWTTLQELSGVQGAEAWADVEALVVAGVCLALSALTVAACARVWRAYGRRR